VFWLQAQVIADLQTLHLDDPANVSYRAPQNDATGMPQYAATGAFLRAC